MVAVELYGVIKEIDELEKTLKSLPESAPEREEIRNGLRKARAQRDRLKKMIEGAKGD